MTPWISYNLRHNKSLNMDSCGWVDINDLISLSPPSKNNKDEIYKLLQDVVKKDKKERYEIIGNKIRATNGHSVLLGNTIMVPITIQDTFTWVVHGTTETSWNEIQKSGFLKKMNRDYIHFAIDSAHLRNETRVEIYLYLHIEQLLQDGYKLFKTTNSVVGSFEDIPVKYLYVSDRPK